MVRYALEHYCAAVVVFERLREHETTAPSPAYSLLGQSIELSLKSLLRSDGMKPEQLKSLGHRLIDCLDQARRGEAVHRNPLSLSCQDLETLQEFSAAYSGRDYNYFGSGNCTAPPFQDLARVAKAICTVALNEIEPKMVRGVWREVYDVEISAPPRPLTEKETRDLYFAHFLAELEEEQSAQKTSEELMLCTTPPSQGVC
jgi:hypothetical protein